MNDEKYRVAFAFMSGVLTTRERLKLEPLSCKELYQMVYDNYGVLPAESVVKELGLKVKETA